VAAGEDATVLAAVEPPDPAVAEESLPELEEPESDPELLSELAQLPVGPLVLWLLVVTSGPGLGNSRS
jgi:hypothetical protein